MSDEFWNTMSHKQKSRSRLSALILLAVQPRTRGAALAAALAVQLSRFQLRVAAPSWQRCTCPGDNLLTGE